MSLALHALSLFHLLPLLLSTTTTTTEETTTTEAAPAPQTTVVLLDSAAQSTPPETQLLVTMATDIQELKTTVAQAVTRSELESVYERMTRLESPPEAEITEVVPDVRPEPVVAPPKKTRHPLLVMFLGKSPTTN